MFAQSLGEYGTLGSVVSGIQDLGYSINAALGNPGATTWIAVAIAVIGLLIWTRR